MSVIELLGEKLRTSTGEFLATSEAVGSKAVVALYFSAHWCGPCRGFTPTLAKKYQALKAANKDFEMVFVSSDSDEESMNEYHSEMPFLAMPFVRRDEKAALSKLFKVSGIPTLVFYDLQKGEVITTKGRKEISADDFVETFPYHPEPPKPVTELLGPELRKGKGEVVKASDALKDVDVLGLYFSAHWCGPCRSFTPQFAKKYAALKAAGKKFECVFVSSDSDEEAFNSYHDEQPWLAMPYSRRKEKEQLSEQMGVNGIPSLILIDLKTGEVITDEARSGIDSDTFIEDFPYPPKPVNDLSGSLKGINDEASLLVIMDSASDEQKKEVDAWLGEVAAAELAKPEKERAVTRFFTGKGGGPLDRIRSTFDLPAKIDDAAPMMLVLDIGGDNPVYLPAEGKGAVTLANLQAFVKDHKEGNSTKKEVSE